MASRSEQEHELANGVVAVRLERDVIRAYGPDAESFLQGQLSQDVAMLEVGTGAWTLLLQPQGKVDAWFRVTRLAPDAFVLDVDPGAADVVLERLGRFKLRTKIEFETLPWSMVALRGPGTKALIDAGVRDVVGTDGVAFAGDPAWPGAAGVDLVGPAPTVPADVMEIDVDTYELARIQSLIPVMGAELHEGIIPAEAGVVERSVSFTKGCYTGQELVARIDSRGGNVPRRLRLISGSGAFAVGDQVLVDDQPVGEITSAAASELSGGHVGLAYVKRSVELADGEVAVGAVAGEAVEISSP